METTIHLRAEPTDAALPLGEILGELAIWLQAEAEDTLETLEVNEDTEQHPGFTARLHPAAEPVSFRDDGEGRLEIHAESCGVGPGYQLYVLDLLKRLADDVSLRWVDDAGEVDETLKLASAEQAEEAALRWLKQSAEVRLEAGADWTLPLTHAAGKVRPCGEALATPLGGRERAWLSAVAADPRAGMDALPWWQEGLGAEWLLGRALSEMWSEVRWRPLIAETEEERVESILDDLEAAYELDPSLAYPFSAWRELYALLDGLREAPGYLAEAPSIAGGGAEVGYRRADVRVRVDGWTMVVPGELLEEWRDEYWWLGDRGRDVFLQSFDAADETPTSLSLKEAIAELPDEAGELFEAHEERIARRAVWQESTPEGSFLHGVVAADRRLLMVTMRFDDAAAREWAFTLWRSIKPESAAE